MGRNTEGTATTIAIGIALVSLMGISATGCGGGDDAVTDANIGAKLAAALCAAEASCCARQGFPESADDRRLCDMTTPTLLLHPSGYVFSHDIAVACVKAAQAYQCRSLTTIEALCRRVYTDPALGVTAPLAGEGATCALDDLPYTCAFYDGLSCVPDSATSSTGMCRKASTSGGSCRDDLGCVAGTYCNQTTVTCTPSVADGAACDAANYDCASGVCSNGVCSARVGCMLG